MTDKFDILKTVLEEALSIKNPTWADYERLKRKLQDNFIFNCERELADALKL